MSVHDLYSKRQRRIRGEEADVYSYDLIPKEFRVQVIHILHDAVGEVQTSHNSITSTGEVYKYVVSTLRREYGVFRLSSKARSEDYLAELTAFMLDEEDTERVLDAIELSFTLIDTYVRDRNIYGRDGNTADRAISELNTRFKEHGLGYQFDAGQIIRIDSEITHSEVVLPALQLLRDPQFSGAENEFLNAHTHYRHLRNKEALVDCLKAIESVIKTICDKRSWPYDSKASCKDLLDICFANGLIPTFWSNHFSGLRSTLEGGVPTARNRLGGHGQGATVSEVPGYISAYAIHLTASAIVFLVEADRALK